MAKKISKPKYFDEIALSEMNSVRKEIYNLRESIYQKYKVDLLDTDALSALSIHEIVSQYDPDYNINFARNGEDAKSKNILIEHKASRVDGNLTRTGKIRKTAGKDAAFQFHAMGDIIHERYILVARNKNDLSIMRIYDISSTANCKVVQDYLLSERDAWLARGAADKSKMKRDIVLLHEKFLLDNLSFAETLSIDGCEIRKD